ncbi:helix-turn-helix domain-containing protein [Gorillibacterium timonense]|uniref:helix-turn-helix domain-containing protein n=1 Tax=Gorillibacterium timonense TaxID=1689269 RepID=UPI00071D9047|nr:helix-turn-helix domain-containing protein [Gorillibacterium timonense]
MFELGQMLKKARLDKGITMEDLQETTKIRKRYLEAIEEGNFKVLPGNFYVRAFIKSYAEAVGLDPNEVLGLYKNVIPASVPETTQEPLRRTRSKPKVPIKWGSWITGLLLWAFFILIVAVLYYFISKDGNDPSKTVTDRDQNKITEKTPAPTLNNASALLPSETPTPSATATPTPTPEATVKLIKSEGSTDFYQISGSATMKLDLEIIGDACWFSLETITNGKKELVEQGSLVNADKRTWESSKALFLRLGRANAAKVTVNGQDLPVGPNPSTKKFQLEFGTASVSPSPETSGE